MRIKISINNSINNNITISYIKIKNDKFLKNIPVLYFNSHKKFQDILQNKTVIFHDKQGKELFRSDNVKINYLYYEEDFGDSRPKKNKVMWVVRDIYIRDLGPASTFYIRKFLRKSCNSAYYARQKQPKISDNPIAKLRKDYSILRYIDMVRGNKFYADIYKYHRTFRFIFNIITAKFIIYCMESDAPT